MQPYVLLWLRYTAFIVSRRQPGMGSVEQLAISISRPFDRTASPPASSVAGHALQTMSACAGHVNWS